MRPMNSGDPVSTHQHQEDGLRSCVGFVVGILAENAQTHTTELLRPMAIPRRSLSRVRDDCFPERKELVLDMCSVRSQRVDEFRSFYC